jgi:hypothetical protein
VKAGVQHCQQKYNSEVKLYVRKHFSFAVKNVSCSSFHAGCVDIFSAKVTFGPSEFLKIIRSALPRF